MSTHLFLVALLGCSTPEPSEGTPEAPAEPARDLPAPKPATSPPQPDDLPPPTPAKGGPLVALPGNYYVEELQMDAGEEVQVICGDALLTARVDYTPVGEGRHMLSVAACPDFIVLFRGLSDRIGSGSITTGIGRGPFSEGRPKGFEAGFVSGVFKLKVTDPETRSYDVELVPDEGERLTLFTQAPGTALAGLNWVGDLDDDNVPDFVINSPESTTKGHLRLFLSAKSKTRQPEQVTDFEFTLW